MAESSPSDNRTLYRRTLISAGAMVGGCAIVVGTLSWVASSIVCRAVTQDGDAPADAGGATPASSAHVSRVLASPPNAAASAGKGQK